MKPLLYLTLRQWLNGFIRAASSPKRLIALLFFIGYYFLIFGRPGAGPDITRGPFQGGRLDFPPMQIVEAIVFAGLAAVSIFMMLGVASQQSAFKPADVDVLFAMPIEPRHVLLFRMIRDYFFTLIVPLFFVVIGFRQVSAGWDALFRNFPNPGYGNMAWRALALGWFLIAISWVSISYATSLFINRSDTRSDFNKKLLSWGLALLMMALIAYVVFQSQYIRDVGDAVDLANSTVLRLAFFLATFGTYLVMAPLSGNWGIGLVGLGGLVGVTWFSIRVAMSQADWMYDQAAVRGFGATNLKELQKQGDVMGVTAELARQGKLKARTIGWIANAKWKGPMALLWKEAFLQIRGMLGLVAMLGLIALFISIVPVLIPEMESDVPVRTLLFFMQGASLMAIVMPLAQVGFIEVLRRVDLLKPLPFSTTAIGVVEVAARGALGALASLLSSTVVSIMRPALAIDALGSFILILGLSMLMSACVWLVTVLFPDVDDHTQRQFRGFVTLIAVAVLGFVPIAVFAPLYAVFHWPAPLAALPASLLALGMALGLCGIAGQQYATFNPSE